jgi:hypothetical protein
LLDEANQQGGYCSIKSLLKAASAIDSTSIFFENTMDWFPIENYTNKTTTFTVENQTKGAAAVIQYVGGITVDNDNTCEQ